LSRPAREAELLAVPHGSFEVIADLLDLADPVTCRRLEPVGEPLVEVGWSLGSDS
jgi:hypothetical protein